MERVPEPELMEGEEQARAYARADFSEPHDRFVALFRSAFPDFDGRGPALDLGCGPGDIALRFARAYPECAVDGLDGSWAMLREGWRALEAAPELAGRVRLALGLLPGAIPPHARYPAVISNSLLHHLGDPGVLWGAVKGRAAPGAAVFIQDLRRPESPEAAAELAERYAAGEPEILRRDFHHSLLAAFTPAEIEGQLRAAGLDWLAVEPVGDRHVVVKGRAPR